MFYFGEFFTEAFGNILQLKNYLKILNSLLLLIVLLPFSSQSEKKTIFVILEIRIHCVL